jgi:hypothetical protein
MNRNTKKKKNFLKHNLTQSLATTPKTCCANIYLNK